MLNSQTLFVVVSILSLISAIVLFLAWRSEKPLRVILLYWCRVRTFMIAVFLGYATWQLVDIWASLGINPATNYLRLGVTNAIAVAILLFQFSIALGCFWMLAQKQTTRFLEQAQHASEERFRTAIENMHDSFGIYTAIRNESGQIEDFLIEYVNEAACKSNCMTREEQVGKRLLDLRPNYSNNGRFAEYCRVVETGEPHVKDALIRDVVSNVVEIVDSRIVKLRDGFTAAWRDITERKKAEDALRLSEERFSKAFHLGPAIGMIRSLDDDRIIDVNDTFLTTLEYERDEVVGHAPMELQCWADQSVFERVFHELKNKGKCKDEEVELRTKSGKIIWALFSAFLTEINGEPCALINYVDITERKRIEEKLRNSEKQLRFIMDTIPSRMVYVDSEKRYKYVNKAHEKCWGVNRNDTQGKYIWEVIGEEAYHEVQVYIDTALSGERVFYENNFPDRDGEMHYFYNVMVPESDDRGTVNGYILLSNDMTEFRVMERKIADALEFNQAIVESSTLGISTFNSSGHCAFTNDASVEISGGTKEQILQITFDDFETWKQSCLLDAAKRVLSTGTPEHLEYDVQNIFGKQAWWDSKLSRFTSGGEPHLLLVSEDITERKEVEEALRQSEKRFSKAFHSSPCAMSITHLSDYRVLDVNQRWQDTLGFSREDIVGKLLEDLNIWAEPQHQQAVERVKNGYGSVANLETVFRNKKGEELDAIWSGEIITLFGEPCLLGAWIDITERKKYEKEVARMDRLELMGKIAGGIAHEIRNPMTVVRGYLQVLQAKEEFASQYKRFDTMIGEIDRANAIITEFLSLAKDKPEEMKRQNINSIVTALVPLIQADVAKSQVAVSLELADVPDLNLDEKEIRQVVLNLVRNGIEAMPQNGKLTIKTSSKQDRVILSIKDQGTGIPPEVLEKLGTPFFTTKETGTGLGLSICYRIAESHNARIEIETGQGGTTLMVSFPAPSAQDTKNA